MLTPKRCLGCIESHFNILIAFMSLLSIVIPCWNAGKYLPEMLDSLRAQTFTDWQAFLVDDLSEDNTCEIIKAYNAIDKRFNLINRDRVPKGAQTCRNIGLHNSIDSKYVCFFDSDDILKDYCLSQRIGFMERHPNLDFSVFPAQCFIDGNINNKGTGEWGYQRYDDDIKAMIDGTIPMVGWTNIYKVKSIVDNNLTWDESLLSLQDSDWNLHAILSGLTYKYAACEGAEVDYLYRINLKNNIAGKIYKDEHILNHLTMLGHWKQMLGPCLSSKYRFELRARAVEYLWHYLNNSIFKRLPLNYLRFDFVLYVKAVAVWSFRNHGFMRLYKSEIAYRHSLKML